MLGKRYQIFEIRFFANCVIIEKLLSHFESQFLYCKFGKNILPHEVNLRIKTDSVCKVYNTQPERKESLNTCYYLQGAMFELKTKIPIVLGWCKVTVV